MSGCASWTSAVSSGVLANRIRAAILAHEAGPITER
jgi:hypothetical protein